MKSPPKRVEIKIGKWLLKSNMYLALALRKSLQYLVNYLIDVIYFLQAVAKVVIATSVSASFSYSANSSKIP